MQQFILSVMERYGYFGICFLILLENLFPPIPSEIILPFGGFLTTYTNLSVWGVTLFSTIGSTAGAFLLYRLGTMLSPQRAGALLDRRLFLLLGFRRENLEKAVMWFERRGKKAVLFGRCVPIVRSLVSIPAGMAGVELPTFFAYTVIGSAVWNLLLVSLGAFLGASWGVIQKWLGVYARYTRIGLWIAAAVLLGRALAKRHKKRKVR